MGFFISFEGGELSGKSTQSKLLYHKMLEHDLPAIRIHEPGTTRLGEYLRDYLISDNSMSDKSELLLFAAARSELVETVIKPTLKNGITVIADRYMHSSIAYQGYGRHLDLDMIDSLNEFVVQGYSPHLTILMDIPVQVTLERAKVQLRMPFAEEPHVTIPRLDKVQLRMPFAEEPHVTIPRLDDVSKRKFEEMPHTFHQNVRLGYHKLAETNSDRWVILDGQMPVCVNASIIWQRVSSLFTLHS